MKHTPGPWRSALDCGATAFPAVYDAQGGKLALVFDNTLRSNAPLLAAAPDMLAALREVLRVFPAQNQTLTEEQHAAWLRAADICQQLE
jgi:hypothetical protein